MPNVLKPSCTILVHIERFFLVATTLIRTCLNALCTQEQDQEQEREQEQQQIMENYLQYSHTVGVPLCGQRRKTDVSNEKTFPCKYRSLKDIMIKELITSTKTFGNGKQYLPYNYQCSWIR